MDEKRPSTLQFKLWLFLVGQVLAPEAAVAQGHARGQGQGVVTVRAEAGKVVVLRLLWRDT